MKSLYDCCRGSLKNVYFPSVTLCNISQGRISLFRQTGLSSNDTLLLAVLRQAYFGSQLPLTQSEIEDVRRIFSVPSGTRRI